MAEPRHSEEYSERQVASAHRVLVDLGQVLAAFEDCLVLVGGWTPALLLPEAEDPHIGSMDVDLVLDANKLNDGRYADLLELLLATGRYERGEKAFQFVTRIDLGDNGLTVQVEVEFLAPMNAKLKRRKKKLFDDFRVLQVDGSEAAFRDPVRVTIPGKNIRGAENTVRLRVVSLSDFLLMKSLAIGGRDKPKDTYDLCFCLQNYPHMEELAKDWGDRFHEDDVKKAAAILKEKFTSPDGFGLQQLVEFHNPSTLDAKLGHARMAYELVQKFLDLIVQASPRDGQSTTPGVVTQP